MKNRLFSVGTDPSAILAGKYGGVKVKPIHRGVLRQRYNSMRQRSKTPNHRERGVTVCPEWRKSFEAFYTWAITAGFKPELQIRRLNKFKNYSPENCIVGANVSHGDLLRTRYRRMRRRCEDAEFIGWKYYGEKGITVCKEWRDSFEAYYLWSRKTGFKPVLWIERIDNNKGFSPENRRWTRPLRKKTKVKRKYRENLKRRYNGMRLRCKTAKYRERGIKVCPEWSDSFEAYYNWAIDSGFKPKYKIERRFKDKDFSPRNCRVKINELYRSTLRGRYAHMRRRCENPDHVSWKYYGGKGITVCKRWRDSFEAYYNWAITSGFKPELWICRTDNTRGYSPQNCRLITPEESTRNLSSNVTNFIKGTRICRLCKQEKPLTEFRDCKPRSMGKEYICKDCMPFHLDNRNRKRLGLPLVSSLGVVKA